jgi:hypothetical protein
MPILFLVLWALASCDAASDSLDGTSDQPPADGSVAQSDSTTRADAALPPAAPSVSVQKNACVDSLVPPASEHACVHDVAGPFVKITAAAAASNATTADVSKVHTSYTLELPPYVSGEGPSYRGFAAFRHSHTPKLSTFPAPPIVFFSNTADVVILAYAATNTRALDAVHQGSLTPIDGCGLRQAIVYPMQTSQMYTVEVYSRSSRQVSLIAEHLIDYASASWRQQCGP